MTRIALYKQRWKGLRIIALAVPLIVIGIWMLSTAPAGSFGHIMGWIGTGFFGLAIPVGLFQTFDRRPQLIITENTIWDRTTKQDAIKWEQIESAYALDIHSQKFVCLILDSTFEPKQTPYKWAAAINERMGAQQVNLSMSQLNIDEHTMTRFILEMTATDPQNRTSVINKYFHQ